MRQLSVVYTGSAQFLVFLSQVPSMSVRQNLLSRPRFPQTVNLRRVSAQDAAVHILNGYSPSQDDTMVLGIAYHTSQSGIADFMCIANLTSAFVVSVDTKSRLGGKEFSSLLYSEVTAQGENSATAFQRNVQLVGFGMARIAIQVNQATRSHVLGVDLSTLFAPNIREPEHPSKLISERVDNSVNRFEIEKLWLNVNGSVETDTALQAWLAACTGDQFKKELAAKEKVCTRNINASSYISTLQEQTILYQLVSETEALEIIKPTEIKNDFSQGKLNKGGRFELQNTRYKTRVRRSDRTQVVLIDDRGREFRGSATNAKGKTTTINFQGKDQPKGALREVKVVGRANSTNSEKARDELIFLILTGHKTLQRSPFLRKLWFPRWKSIDLQPTVVDFGFADRVANMMKLNDSQRAAMHGIVGDQPLVVVHGPPGTGKTTTIAAASRIWDLGRLPVWIVAHSNVAVKNIAETLFKKDVNFSLLVSKEFYEEWHEHLYVEIQARLIRSDELPKDRVGMERVIADSRIVLCTLSMISNPALYENGTFDIVPLERLIIDEASQINIFEFMSIFERFQETLEKVSFFGDPKQLPPHGQEDVPDMRTVFDLGHIKETGNCHFLNMQYRMPVAIGHFISRFVYDGKLLSQHEIQSSDCLAFIDASRTAEERVGSSRRNLGEIDVIVNLVKHYYRNLNFCVITPYDAQRAAIQRSLEIEKLPWESVYNVDSFQGNEADYVLISAVRTAHPGFLQSLNRLNVLLSRCRKGMVIVSSSAFLGFRGSGSGTLLGKLVANWQSQYPSHKWVDWRSVANATVSLPGCPARKVLAPTTHCAPKRPPLVPFSVLGNSSQQSRPSLNMTDQRHFPPLPKQPLLQGSWAPSIFRQLQYTPHPHSLIHRRPVSKNDVPISQRLRQAHKNSPLHAKASSNVAQRQSNQWQSSQHLRQVHNTRSPQHAKANYSNVAQWQTNQRQSKPASTSHARGKVGKPSYIPAVDRFTFTSHLQTQGFRSKNSTKEHSKSSSSSFIRSVTVHSR